MSMQMSSRDVEGVTILDLKGRLTLGDGTSMLREGVRACLNQSKQIVINLAGVDYIDSAGLGELVGCHAAAANRSAVLGLMNVNDRVHGLLRVTKLYSVFEVFNSEDAAVLGMKAQGAAGA
jgi:anti-sigma B factor antagonist